MQRPPRPVKTGLPYWAIPNATSKRLAKRKKPPTVVQPMRPARSQRRMEDKPDEPRDLVTLRFRLSWSIPAVLGILLFILGLLTAALTDFQPTIAIIEAIMWRSSLYLSLPAATQPPQT